MNGTARNALFDQKEYMIRQTMSKHSILLRVCHMDAKDVYQELAVRMLESLDQYDACKCSNLDAF